MTTRREFVVGTTLAAGFAAVPGAWRMPAPPVDRIERVGLELYTLRAAMKAEDRKSTRLNSSHSQQSRMPSSA